jgi:hypothetical protein
MSYKEPVEIVTREGDRRLTVRKSSFSSDAARIDLTEFTNDGDGVAVVAYLTKDRAIDVARALVEFGGLTEGEIFGPKKIRFEVGDYVELTGRNWGHPEVGQGSPNQGSVVKIAEVSHFARFVDQRGRYWDVVPEGHYSFDTWGARKVDGPRSAREIIEFLPVGSTFSLTRDALVGGSTTRYFRVDEVGVVKEYADDTFTTGGQSTFRLSYGGMFGSWSVSDYEAVEPREVTAQERVREVFDALPLGGKFRMIGGLGIIRIKVGKDTYVREGGKLVKNIDQLFMGGTTGGIEAITD